ncbi:LutC/YkgG family protein [Autumnicola psychrophila]|uniref:LUD domain-containing protein n=1 Tax=Autumnicola psychrophila TaxID=3075592 RepID=A0ABU3DUQ8_9FLAO|nr:LUD domain-containing protein [Zunongwangia sp. F225]MDT0687209.1 LUD domain-containing protein [Zunongwangia sp. F225]
MSKAAILERIKKNKPELVELPDLSVFQHEVPQENLIKDFIEVSTGNMSNVVSIIDSEVPLQTFLKEFIAKNFPLATTFYDLSRSEEHPTEVDFTQTPVDLFIAEAKLGVAENGGLWFDDSILKQRISTFACEHTLMIIDHKTIVPTMHQAYQKIKIAETGYGVFIAGPSKTADIEQSLVVGAQGAVSNTVILI